MSASESRPTFTTSQSAADEKRAAFEEQLEAEGRKRVGPNSFGRATSVSLNKPSPWDSKHTHRPVYSRGLRAQQSNMTYSPLGEPSPAQIREDELRRFADQQAQIDARKPPKKRN